MEAQLVKLSTLNDLVPGLEEAFAREVSLAAGDCANRPFLTKPREITLKIRLTPVIDGAAPTANDALDTVKVNVVMKGSNPALESKDAECRYRTQRGEPTLLFHHLSREDADQAPLPFQGEDE